jgi:hypothetical protein
VARQRRRILLGFMVRGDRQTASMRGRSRMTTFLRALAVLLFSAITVAADELPKDLLLQCDGKSSAVMDVPRSESRNGTFRLGLHVKDGSVSDTMTNVVEGTGCVQNNGEIKCEVTKQYSFPNSILKRFSTVVINRNTREVTLWVESWEYQGQDPSDSPTAHVRVLRTGVCRDNTLF